ncbi:SCPL20, partial [Symbiodinium microadriaticum]
MILQSISRCMCCIIVPCSENGQIQTNDDSLSEPVDGIPQVFYNDYGWTKMANMLYLESPKGVGFSYCDDAQTEADCVNTDQSTALDAYDFLVNWFALYPEYQSHKFYITGESYAGIYIPMLMQQIDLNPLGAPQMNLVGAA